MISHDFEIFQYSMDPYIGGFVDVDADVIAYNSRLFYARKDAREHASHETTPEQHRRLLSIVIKLLPNVNRCLSKPVYLKRIDGRLIIDQYSSDVTSIEFPIHYDGMHNICVMCGCVIEYHGPFKDLNVSVGPHSGYACRLCFVGLPKNKKLCPQMIMPVVCCIRSRIETRRVITLIMRRLGVCKDIRKLILQMCIDAECQCNINATD